MLKLTFAIKKSKKQYFFFITSLAIYCKKVYNVKRYIYLAKFFRRSGYI